jgi:hypothetical protein
MAANLAVGVVGMMATATQAEVVTYVIDVQQSSLSISGNLFGNAAGPQTPGSLTTSYTGTIQADRTGGTIRFTGGSVVDAVAQSTAQQPRADATPGSATADYGRTAETGSPFFNTGREALRGLVLDVFDDTEGAGATITNGQFSRSAYGLEIDAGSSDAMIGDTQSFEKSLAGLGTANGGVGAAELTLAGNVETLRLPFSTGPIAYTLSQSGDTTLQFSGLLVATRTVVPEPAMAGFLVLGSFGLLARRRA